MIDGRRRARARAIVAAVFATSLGATLISGAPGALAKPKPTVSSQQEKVDQLFHQAEQASEHYNAAHEQLQHSRTVLSALRADLARQQGVVSSLRGQVASLVVDQYQGQGISTASQLVLSTNPSDFLDNVSAVSAYNSQRGDVMRSYGVELSRLELRAKAVRQEASALGTVEDRLAHDKAAIDAKAAEAKKQLDAMKAEERQRYLASQSTAAPAPVDVSVSGSAAAAVHYAMAQVGKAYVYGAAGPSAFDCSGLTMRAWGAAGIGLPHSSAAQYNMGTHVSESELQPGDLVFYYSPISHVGMYIGNGLIVNAENPSVGVKVTGLHSMPYAGAVRVH
ncbi:MAG: NlpC/P60 family protein [Marmoricola sp.]